MDASSQWQIEELHSDSGSEYINRKVANMLDKLRIEQTKSRARHSNDNALAESKNASVVRKHMGYSHIPQKYAKPINAFYEGVFNPWLNTHRPCLFAQADFAVGCGYKYLNGGPGSPAYLYVAARHQATAASPISGWLGHARPFDFVDDYAPAPGVGRFLAGAHPILGLTALEVGVDLMLKADVESRDDKSSVLSTMFVALVEARCTGLELTLASPRRADQRGSHIALRHEHAYAVMQALISRGVVGDFRAPDLMRFGFAPLYNRHADIWHAVETLRQVLHSRAWDRPEFHQAQRVT